MSELDHESKQEIDRLINIYLDGRSSISNDAGWEGDSRLSLIIDYEGCPPDRSGNDQSNMKMINSIRLLRKTSPDFMRIDAAVELAKRYNFDKVYALTAKHYYKGLSGHQDRAYTDEIRAIEIGQTYGAFKSNVRQAYRVIQDELDRVDIYAAYNFANINAA